MHSCRNVCKHIVDTRPYATLKATTRYAYSELNHTTIPFATSSWLPMHTAHTCSCHYMRLVSLFIITHCHVLPCTAIHVLSCLRAPARQHYASLSTVHFYAPLFTMAYWACYMQCTSALLCASPYYWLVLQWQMLIRWHCIAFISFGSCASSCVVMHAVSHWCTPHAVYTASAMPWLTTWLSPSRVWCHGCYIWHYPFHRHLSPQPLPPSMYHVYMCIYQHTILEYDTHNYVYIYIYIYTLMWNISLSLYIYMYIYIYI